MNSIGGSTVTGHFDQFLDDASATKPDHYTIYSKGSARVERLIPDPLGVTPGIILSQSSGSMTASPPSGNTICGITVDTTTALVQSSVPVLCPVGRTYQFTTAPSGTTLQTVIQVRNYPSFLPTCDGTFSAGSYKSQVTLTPSGANTGYTFIAAATPAVKPSAGNAIQVQINIR